MRPGLRTAAVLLLFAFGCIPAIAVLLLTASTQHRAAEVDLDARLTDASHSVGNQLGNEMERFRQILLTSARNPAFVYVLKDADRRAFWQTEVNQALLQLTSTFPGMIDEACRIDEHGVELGRVVKGEVAPDDELEEGEESSNPAFWPTMALPAGAVHYEPAYLSPDTGRWVLAAATPVYADGESNGILHFEVPLAYYYRLVQAGVPADGFIVLAGPDGRTYVDSTAAEPGGEPLPSIATLLGEVRDDSGDSLMTGADAAFGLWMHGGMTYRVRHETVEAAPGLRMTVLVGAPVVPSFLEGLGGLVPPLAIAGLMVLVLAVALAGLVVRPRPPTARPTAGATGRGRVLAGWFIPVVAVVFAGTIATGLGMLNDAARRQMELEVRLAQLDGDVGQLDVLADRVETDPRREMQLQERVDEVQREVVRDLDAVGRLADDGSISDRLERAFAQYQVDFAEQRRLLDDGRTAEASLWRQQRARSSLVALGEAVDGASALARAAYERVGALVNIGSSVALLFAAFVLGVLAWRFTQTRRAADLLATEQHTLRRSEERFRKLVQHGAELVAILAPDGTVRYASPSTEALLGIPADEFTGTTLMARVHPDDVSGLRRLLEGVLVEAPKDVQAEFRLRHAEGSWRHLEVLCRNLLDDAEIGGIVLNARDVTERTALQAQLSHRAFHDELTELPNRALLLERLGHALARGTRTGRQTAVLFIDLDDFKVVNDSLGHRVGDQLLVAVAERLTGCMRPGDTAARIGGDEFVVLVEDLVRRADAEGVGERVAEELRAPFVLQGRQVFVGASIGIAVGGVNEFVAPDDLLRQADVAMYTAKNRGRGQSVVYDSTMDAQPMKRLEMEADLRRALERQEFRLHYQPIVELTTGRVTGVEALLRWEHPQRGLVPPARFIPLAEETGLIVPIGRWALYEACRQAQAWRDAGAHPSRSVIVMSVNLSGRQFQHPRLVEDVAEALRDTGLPPELLKLEITESVAMEAGIGTIQTLQALRGLGVRMAIDDFGTGYSSLAYLKRFPVDTLKVDRSFVDSLGQDPQDTAIVRSVVSLAKTLGLSVTAEGVETVQQREELRAAGCDEAQGYYFARPQPSEQVSALVAVGRIGAGAEVLLRAS